MVFNPTHSQTDSSYQIGLPDQFKWVGHFTPALALYDPFGVDVPLNFDITHSVQVELISITLIHLTCTAI